MKPVVASTAYLLISHGSRDPRPQEAMNRLADLVRKHLETDREAAHLPLSNTYHEQDSAGKTTLLTRPLQKALSAPPSEVIVGTACLELAPISLSEQIYRFAVRLKAAGVSELKLLPMFLMPGVHVTKDIPAEVDAARELLKDDWLKLTLCPHLGSHSKITAVLASRLASAGIEAGIDNSRVKGGAKGSLLVAHGSRRPKGNQAIKGLAGQLGTAVAYWATPPDIESQVIDLMQQGCQKLTILPYFLFAGGITDAIVHRTEELAERFPSVNFRLLPTLGATDEVADLAVELIH